MKLIRKLGTRINKNGFCVSWGIFLCSYCLKEFEYPLSDGYKCKSCGCFRNRLISKAKKGIKRTEETIQKIKDNHADFSGENGPMFGKKFTKIHRQKIAKTRIEKGLAKGKNNPFYGIRKFGKENPNWNNGSSFEPYSPEFSKEKKKQILERDNYECQNPNYDCLEITDLHIHHIDYNKQNNNPENLITLCNSCHSKTVGKN